MRLSTGLLILAPTIVAGCSLYHDLIPIIYDGGCTSSTGCSDGATDDMQVGGDGGMGGLDMRLSCVDSSTCPAALPVCSNGACGLCEASNDMSRSMECANYHSSTNPPTPFCGHNGTCVQCLSKDDCAQLNQTCKQMTNTCVPCSSHGECSTGVCKSDGACAAASEIYYVDNRGAPTIAACKSAHPTADGTSSVSAFCDMIDATDATMKRPYVVVTGSTTAYSALSFTTSATETIIGPGRDASPTALVFTPTLSPAINVAPASGQTVTLTIDGLELIGSSGAITNQRAGLSCSAAAGTATTNVLKSYIHNSGGSGVDSSSCTLTLDSNVISQNSGGGVNINGGSYVVRNNLIVGNGTAGPGVVLAGNFSSALWWFNTIADNLRTGSQAAAFNCGGVLSSPPLIQASIIWGNTKNSTESSIGLGCSFSNNDIDDSTMPLGAGNFKMDPMLTTGPLPEAGYRIPTGSPCQDKISSSTGLTGGTLPNHDVDGLPRPRSSTGGYDCGASQAP